MGKVLVIGGGLIGMLTAAELVEAGAEVVLVERGETGREASWAGGGILSPLHPWRYPDAVTELARWSQSHYRAFCDRLVLESGVDPERTESGLLILDSDEQDAAVGWAGRFGYRLDALEGDALRACEPALSDRDRSGLWMPDVAQVRNPRLVRALRRFIERLGVEVRERCEVQALRLDGGRLRGVDTSCGDIGAERVVVAGGAWTASILGELGRAVEVAPVRGQMALFRAEPGLLTRILLQGSRYLIPRRDGRILVGSTLEHTGFDKSTTAAALADLWEAAAALVPDIARYPVEHHWAGLRPGSPAGVPYIGEHPQVPGLYVNAGHFRNGVVLGLASARLTADLVVGRGPIIDPAPYAVDAVRSE